METEAREILKVALSTAPATRVNLAEAIRRRIDPLGGVDLVTPPREPLPPPVDFAE